MTSSITQLNPDVTISVEADGTGFRLMATSYGRIAVAGPRLFRAPPHPDIQFLHATKSAATSDANKLQHYLNNLTRRPSKRQLRGFGAGDYIAAHHGDHAPHDSPQSNAL